MRNTWWKNLDELDPDQRAFMRVPIVGKHLLTGPPGSGKTNLLLLRAKYIYASGKKNLMFLTYTNSLVDFIRSGIDTSKFFSRSLIRTYDSWAMQHIKEHSPEDLDEFKSTITTQTKTNEDRLKLRSLRMSLLKNANGKINSGSHFDAILIDEAQDISSEEIGLLNDLTDSITIAGDWRQALYNRDGLDSAGFENHELKFHYRIGNAICEIADKLLPPKDNSSVLLKDCCNYAEETMKSDAVLEECSATEDQHVKAASRIRQQLRAFPDESIGVIFPTNQTLQDFRSYLRQTDLEHKTAFHDGDSGGSFCSDTPIHVLTIHSSKGAEFRAVHIMNCESLKFPLHKSELIFTAATRAKTSLTLYYSGSIKPKIESAFAQEITPNLNDLF